MRIVNLSQNTDEWLSWRRGKITATAPAVIMGISPYQTRNALWREIVLGERKDIFSPIMQRGKDLEPVAKAWVESETGMSFEPICVESESNPRHAASLDGYDPIENVVLELKCPLKANHDRMLSGDIPDIWRIQVAWQLYVTQASYAILASFSGIDGICHRIDHDPVLLDRMLAAVGEFEKSIDDLEEPKATDADYIKETSPEWLEYAELKKKTTEALRQAKHDDDVVKAKLEELAAGRVRIRSEGLIYYETISKGAIDWLAFLESKGIDPKEAEAFRKAPVVRTNVRIS